MKIKYRNVIIAVMVLVAVISGVILGVRNCGDSQTDNNTVVKTTTTNKIKTTSTKVTTNTTIQDAYSQYIEAINEYNKAVTEYYNKITELNVKINEMETTKNWYKDQVASFKPERESWNTERAQLIEKNIILQGELDKYQNVDYNATKEIGRLNDKYDNLKAQLDKVKARQEITTTTNLTAEKRNNFFEMYDLWYKTIKWE